MIELLKAYRIHFLDGMDIIGRVLDLHSDMVSIITMEDESRSLLIPIMHIRYFQDLEDEDEDGEPVYANVTPNDDEDEEAA